MCVYVSVFEQVNVLWIQYTLSYISHTHLIAAYMSAGTIQPVEVLTGTTVTSIEEKKHTAH